MAKYTKIEYIIVLMEDMRGEQSYYIIDKNSPKYSPYFAHSYGNTLEEAQYLKKLLEKTNKDYEMEYTFYIPHEYLFDTYNGLCKVVG